MTRRNDSGISLLELLITLSVLTVVVSSIISYYGISLRNNIITNARTELRFLAEQEMEKRLSFDYFSSELDSLNDSDGLINYYLEDEKFIIKTTIVHIDRNTTQIPDDYPSSRERDTKLKKIIVSVARIDGKGGQVDLVTFKSP